MKNQHLGTVCTNRLMITLGQMAYSRAGKALGATFPSTPLSYTFDGHKLRICHAEPERSISHS